MAPAALSINDVAVFSAKGWLAFARGGIDKEAAAPAGFATAEAARATWSADGGERTYGDAVEGGGDEADGACVDHSGQRTAGKAGDGRSGEGVTFGISALAFRQ